MPGPTETASGGSLATRNAMRWAMLMISMGTVVGCGYTSDSLYRQNVRTVYVEMFQSKEFRRGLEMQLTEALRKQIDLKSPYRNAPRNRADSVVSGEVLEVRQGTLGSDFEGGLPRELAATIVVRYQWKDMRTGEILVERPTMVQTVEYIPPAGESFFQASEEGMNKLARRIVETMEVAW